MDRPERHYGRYVGVLGLVIVALITVNTVLTKPNGATGIAPGRPLAPFAVPLVLSELKGDANVATHADDGSAGKVPACSVRKSTALNICQLYERGPLVLALFVDGGSCPKILSEMQTLVPQFPQVQFAAVAIEGGRTQLRHLIRSRALTFPVGIDEDGVLTILYKVASCPQVTLAYPGGTVQSKPLLAETSLETLRTRIDQLLAASRARGWQGAA
jgi:hypothetical protein